MSYRENLLDIFQIELTNYCDMVCPYCPHATMTRAKGHMNSDILQRCLDHVKKMGKDRIVLHHFGESLLHPQLHERLQQVKQANLVMQFSTNGTLLEKKLPMMIALDAPMDITLSVHQWTSQPVSAYWEALAAFQFSVQGTQVCIHRAYNVSREKYFFCKWVNGRVREWDYNNECYFLRENSAVVLWNGDIASCCLDCHGESVFANITQPGALQMRTAAWRGCPTCDLGYRSRQDVERRESGLQCTA